MKLKKMKTLRETQKQQRNSEYRDRQRFEDELKGNEPQEHLHQNYRHWAWLPAPKSILPSRLLSFL